jgi:hypothetical protein
MLQNEHAINYKIKMIHFEIFIIDSQQKEKGWSDSVRNLKFYLFFLQFKISSTVVNHYIDHELKNLHMFLKK